MIQRLITSITIAIIVGCATVSSPYGGEKDEKNPTLISSTPKAQQINFKGKSIELTFDEWIKVEQLNKELIITPKTTLDYEYSNRKETVTVSFKKNLEDSTTYTFNFRNAIKDITENNIWENSTFAFSTGPYLDSMEIKGNIKNIFTNKPAQNYVVGLYPIDSDTANLRQGYPLYFTTTNKEGDYKIANIKTGKYRLYTFLDKNDNLINNSAEESYGFKGDIIKLKDSISTVDLKTYFSNEDTLIIKNVGPSGKDFKISINKPLKVYSINQVNDDKKHIYSSVENNAKEIRIYKENYPAIKNDSVKIVLSITDSIGSKLLDTLYIKFRESKIANDPIKIVQKPETTIFSGNQTFYMSLNKPVAKVNYDSINIIIGDSITIQNINEGALTFHHDKSSFELTTQLIKDKIDSIIKFHQQNIVTKKQEESAPQQDSVQQEKKETPIRALNPSLKFGIGAMIGIEGDSTKSVVYPIKFLKNEDFGIIKGKIIGENGNYIVRLTNSKYEVIDTIKTQEEYIFKNVSPGSYNISVIEDINNNGSWDPGNPMTLKEQENIVHYEEVITVKANWEILDINFNMINIQN